MAYIFIRGRQDAIEVDQADAIRVKNDLESGQAPSTVVSFKDSVWKLAEIKGVKLDPKEQEDGFKAILEKYRTDRQELLSLSLEERAKKSLSHFELFYWSNTGEKSTNELKQKALGKIIEFFKENPHWTLPSITIYKDLLDKIIDNGTMWHGAGIRALTECEYNERKLAGHILKC